MVQEVLRGAESLNANPGSSSNAERPICDLEEGRQLLGFRYVICKVRKASSKILLTFLDGNLKSKF